MNAKLSELRALFLALGNDAAEGYGAKQMTEKVKSIGRYAEATQNVKDTDQLNLYDRVAKAVEAGEAVEVEDDGDAPPPARRPAGKKGGGKKGNKSGKGSGGKKAAAPKPAKPAFGFPPAGANGTVGGAARGPTFGMTFAERYAHYAKHPATLTGRGAGVTQTVIDELRAAGKGANPAGVTKENIIDVLAQKFPDRDSLKMRTYVSNLVPTRLVRKFGLPVQKGKNEKGEVVYWLTDGGASAAGSVSAPAKKAAKKPAGNKAGKKGTGKKPKKAGKKPAPAAV